MKGSNNEMDLNNYNTCPMNGNNNIPNALNNSDNNNYKVNYQSNQENPSNGNNTNDRNSALRGSLRKNIYSGVVGNSNNNFSSYSNINMKFCSLHNNRPLEILCLDHNLRLCSNCALFGEHKNHNIINEEDYIKELEIKSEVLIDFYELIDKNCSSFEYGLNNNFPLNFNSTNTLSESNKNHLDKQNLDKAIISPAIQDSIQSESLNKNTADITENISISNSTSLINPRDLFDDLSLKANKKCTDIKNKIDNFFYETNKCFLKRQKILNEKVSNFFDLINNKIYAFSIIPNELISKADAWKASVKTYFEMFNEITEKDDVIFKIIQSQVNTQDFITAAELIMDEYIKLKNFPFKELSDLIDNVSMDMKKLEEDKRNKHFALYIFFCRNLKLLY